MHSQDQTEDHQEIRVLFHSSMGALLFTEFGNRLRMMTTKWAQFPPGIHSHPAIITEKGFTLLTDDRGLAARG